MKRTVDTSEFGEFAGFLCCLALIVGLVVCGVRPDLVYSFLIGVLPL